MDDRSLLLAVGRGDDHALRELFERHAPWMTIRLRHALPPAAVEDVLQETFIGAWKGARNFKGDGEVGAWLWGIGRRQAAAWLRKNGGREAELDLETAAPGDPAEEAADKAALQQALETLGREGTEQRELVRLALEEGRSMAEVAAHMGLSEGTVKSRLHRVRRRLRKALRQEGR